MTQEREKLVRIRSLYAREGLSSELIHEFQQVIYESFTVRGRRFPWRETTEPYHIVVSEVMLQQTQTLRVVPKFCEFIAAFPSFADLAAASLSEILKVWQGLGYNRRAKALKELAHIVITTHRGDLPREPSLLQELPGLGKATAASIAVFAYNRPEVFIETNIRAVYIYSFYPAAQVVSDLELTPLVAATLDRDNPRRWYNAVMDYGVMLKKAEPEVAARSKHYSKQSRFQGSDRQIRGAVLKLLLEISECSLDEVHYRLGFERTRVMQIMQDLVAEGLILESGKGYRIP